MSDTPVIRMERQAGGWIWMAVVSNPVDGSSPLHLHSTEAVESREDALRDADNVLKQLDTPPE